MLRGYLVLQFFLNKKCNPIFPKALAQNTCSSFQSILGTNSRPISQESLTFMKSIDVHWGEHAIPLAISSTEIWYILFSMNAIFVIIG